MCFFKKAAVTKFQNLTTEVDQFSDETSSHQTNRTTATSTAGAQAMAARISNTLDNIKNLLSNSGLEAHSKGLHSLIEVIQEGDLHKTSLLEEVNKLTKSLTVVAQNIASLQEYTETLDGQNQEIAQNCTELEDELLSAFGHLKYTLAVLQGESQVGADEYANSLERDIIETGGEGTEYTQRILSETRTINEQIAELRKQGELDVSRAVTSDLTVGALRRIYEAEETRSVSSGIIQYEERQIYDQLLGEVHAGFSEMIGSLYEKIDFTLGVKWGVLATECKEKISQEKSRWELLQEAVREQQQEAENERSDALARLMDLIDKQIKYCDTSLLILNKKTSVDMFRELNRFLSSFVISSDDARVEVFLDKSIKKTELLIKKVASVVGEIPLSPQGIYAHLVYGNVLQEESHVKIHKNKLDNLKQFLVSLQSRSLRHYQVLDELKTFAVNDFPKPATQTPQKKK